MDLRLEVLKRVSHKIDPYNNIEDSLAKTILNLYNKLDHVYLSKYPKEKVIETASSVIYEKLKKEGLIIKKKIYTDKSSLSIKEDIHEKDYFENFQDITDQQTINVNIDSILGIKDVNKLKLLLNPSSLWKHHYIVLDTRNRYRSNTNINELRLKWNSNSIINEFVPGTFYTKEPLRNIVSFKIHEITPSIPYNFIITPLIYLINFEELSSQAYFNNFGRRFHFIARQARWTDRILRDLSDITYDDKDDAIFRFDPVIKQIDSLTFTMESSKWTGSLKEEEIYVTFQFTNESKHFIIPLEFITLNDNL